MQRTDFHFGLPASHHSTGVDPFCITPILSLLHWPSFFKICRSFRRWNFEVRRTQLNTNCFASLVRIRACSLPLRIDFYPPIHPPPSSRNCPLVTIHRPCSVLICKNRLSPPLGRSTAREAVKGHRALRYRGRADSSRRVIRPNQALQRSQQLSAL